ncbi:Bug family tripartite tricarboxylate transporter substrate binding protein [Bordetella holmesii]|uniref:Tripartite tricarboxylate transporter family receptor n=2 Tax=Bordetella holmesii TaxID=35814 RepID=A0A158LZ35_9BORD|nr:tripartite tricarboxylate transporter substrate binding protein [Bordetella holmesii]AHV93691.1 tripartite tricarboxylate transporter receptor family protein [Bordetella holmesii ATCC 51541]AIT27709.1 tripartite tricarboxylate transporter receptor family protein [Bordetella holmesii 44057]EWM40484.1 tripartite tricarboxylate transporter receptor family protein [Bordetella holmesii 35009]EWM49286.1 tripartite tricarboxylate transporter receptor family protein [Bordetella holmesii 70147]AMD46
MQLFRRLAALAACSVVASIATATAHAADAGADWPQRPVTLYLGFPPGTSTDMVARLLGEQFSKRWGQPVIVENKPGVGGSLGAATAARMPADGYTLLLSASGPMSINPHVYKNVGYDSATSFAPITQTTWLPYALVVRPDFQAKSLQELIALARSQPGKLTYASTGVGTNSHLIMAMLQAKTGMTLTHVPYKGSSQSQADVLGGNVDMTFDTLASELPMIQSKRLMPLAVSKGQRTDLAPDVPTVAEQGFPNFEVGAWLGLFAPAGTPDAVVRKVFDTTQQVMNDPAVRQKMITLGSEVRLSQSPEAFAAMMRDDYAMWGKVVEETGAKSQ